MSVAPQIKGWCPSAWRPMLTGDGYLVRLHFSCGIVSSDQARAVATLARRYGNGSIDLTRRANLQIRGVAEARISELQAELVAQGLIGDDAAADTTPNVIASALAGRDREALIDIRPLVQQLETRLAKSPRAQNLPAKFCIAVSDGGRFSLLEIGADIAFEACRRDRFAVRIGGSGVVGFVEADGVADTAIALVTAFVSLRAMKAMPARRMRELVGEVGQSAIFASCPALRRASTRSSSAHDNMDGRAKPGHEAVGSIDSDVFAVAAPFGSFSADQLQLLADLAVLHAQSELRLTPWRTILIPAIASGAIGNVGGECARAGLITDASDPRRHVLACTGAPACASASVKTRDIAAALAPLVRAADTLHVSGCAKSCASSAPASVTLVGRRGRFDLVYDGKVSDAPALFGLSPEEARVAVQQIAAEDLAHV
ncbi:MAG: precorrin-3B synthase [Methylobacteriaceae bacterium]|nr:precorrin-3B synthase [Methylobacteriaceae bacterium]